MTAPDNDRPESGLWKDYVNRKAVAKMAKEIGRVYKGFDQASFIDAVVNEPFLKLELKPRIAAIAQGLQEYLPEDYGRTMEIFKKIAPQLGGWENWALMSYVELFGLERFEQSVAAMKELTRYSSAEFAIRPYMIRYEKRMLPILHRWAGDSNEHVRRLAAEGCRPRGVWTAHLESFKKDPRSVLKLLEKLKADSSLYVRKAVANNLNDISKDHPDLVIKTALTWKKDGNKHTNWIIKHACRSLIKKGDARVFPIFGFTSNPEITLERVKLTPKKVKIGSRASLSFDVVSKSSRRQKLAIDYRIHYVKKNGKRSAKVFKLSEKVIAGGEGVKVKTDHSFENRSTRKHYAGKHRLDVIVNGTVAHTLDFTLSN
jgi:3-methyladenine DNA glycosylase AlkC